jgi:hypothetical protein
MTSALTESVATSGVIPTRAEDAVNHSDRDAADYGRRHRDQQRASLTTDAREDYARQSDDRG